jgi:hypothetical protein
MKRYRIIQKGHFIQKGHLVFLCDKCDYKIELEKFGLANRPQARTLAAKAMNDHIRKNHPAVPFDPTTYGIR